MSKIRLTMIALMMGLFLALASGAANADSKYPVATPAPTPAVLSGSEPAAATPAEVASDNSDLPGTGGPSLAIIVAGIAFVAVGATVVVASRGRRHSAR